MKLNFKKLYYTLSILLLGLLTACSCDDDNNGTGISNSNYIPLTLSNYWTYDTEITDPTGNTTTGRDSLYVATTTIIDSKLYADLDATATSTGVMTGILSQNFIRSENDKLYLKGTIDLDLTPVGGSLINILIDDAILLDASASVNSLLSKSNIFDYVSVVVVQARR